MPAREEPDLLRAIERGEIAPIYCLHGPERFLVDRTVAALRRKILGASAGDSSGLNCELFDLKEVALVEVLAAARTLPMFAKQRLVIARGLEQVKADGLEPLTAYAAHPNPSTCLVLLAEKIDGRLRAFLALRKAGYLHEFARLKDRELGPFIAREAKTRGMTIDSDAAEALASAAGPDLGRLMQALEQLEIYVGKGGSHQPSPGRGAGARIARAKRVRADQGHRHRRRPAGAPPGHQHARQPRTTLAHSGHVAAPASANLARQGVGRRERTPRRNGRCGWVCLPSSSTTC